MNKRQKQRLRLALRLAIEQRESLLDAYSYPYSNKNRKWQDGIDKETWKHIFRWQRDIIAFKKLLKGFAN